ncbi:dihydroorotate dehydrogenase electron transfer subunit PyrK [Thermacetogenium phaeum DSM 12270]|uniref:Dihydroorotate dehydrogenase B (NAD(+)), electron transfer subunit n=1 Tax=Thermacetogenium phaeum (strain ATCC BAA-254 / DSM 26808 / PB) TaxID=1089553 RepID=K4LFK7_THEPS|nr:dihydroorotate dehydrogenase electron transfer subunit [Thermacetogenium phaeum]AFV11653.1 dihydroorotate dehydrogenase electron transfer subunit PyrK [Thermacetogenium phaeum DSM 12270]
MIEPGEYTCRVIVQNCLSPGYYLLSLEAPELARGALPGQFVMIRCGDCYDPFLRRPLSIHYVDGEKGEVQFLYQVRGKGTALLAERSAGDKVQLLGPLGRGFSCAEEGKKGVLLGAGVGVAPILYLASSLKKRRWELLILMGARSREGILRPEVYELYGRVAVATEDGSSGWKGSVLGLLKEKLKQFSFDKIFACGPLPVLKGVQQLSIEKGIPAEISLEERMACGVGACLGCTCRGSGGKQLRVCLEGPVFAAEEVIFDG